MSALPGKIVARSQSDDRSPQVLRINRIQALPGVIPGMPQSSIVLRLDVRADRIKRLDVFHDLAAVRASLAPLSADRAGVRFSPMLGRTGAAKPTAATTAATGIAIPQRPRHAIEQLCHLLVAAQESAGLTLFARPLVTAMALIQPAKNIWSVRLMCPTPNPTMLMRVAPELVRILNQWFAAKPFEALPAALEKMIAELVKVAPPGQNCRLLLDAAHRLDVPMQSLFGRTMQFGWGSRARWMDSSITDCTSAIATQVARDKRLASRFLAAQGLPVPRQMDASTIERAREVAGLIGYPLVVKPANLDGGLGVTADVKDEEELIRAHKRARYQSPQIIIEAHVPGQDYRLGVVHGKVEWVTQREPAGVTGDGASTVQQLVDLTNQDPRRGRRRWSLMSPLTINDEAETLLAEQGIKLGDVPERGRFVRLRSAANVSSGGTPTEISPIVHPDNKALAVRAARLMRLDLAGVDLIIPDISRSWREVGGAICEVNAQPQFTVAKLDVPFTVVGSLFKGDGRIPVTLVLGGEVDIARDDLIAAFRAKGMRLGLALPAHVSVDGAPVHLDHKGPFEAVRALLVDPDVDAVVALIADESWRATGLPLDRTDLMLCAQDANPRIKDMLTPLCAIGSRALGEGQLASQAGAEALAEEMAQLRDWHDSRPLPVERIASAALAASPYCRKGPPVPGSIGLCMIAKNEAAVICEGLESVRGLVDFVLVQDNGSADGTQEVVRQWLADNGVAGAVVEAPWRDFAWNRTKALADLRAHHDVDYALVLDADDLLVLDEGFDVDAFKAGLAEDVYDLSVHYGAMRFPRPQLLRNARAFGFRGVLHEFVEVPADSMGRKTASGLHIEAFSRGARSRNPEKYKDDAALLERALRDEQDPKLRSRYLFYLAQSYQDDRQYPKALEFYLERAAYSFWPDEMYVAAYRAAALKERLGYLAVEVEEGYRRAIALSPKRMEAYHGLSRFFRLKKRFDEGLAAGREGLERGDVAREGLFIEFRIYQFALREEVALNAGMAGRHDECIEHGEAILAATNLPDRVQSRIERMIDVARQKLASGQGVAGVTQLLAAAAAQGLPSRAASSPGHGAGRSI